MHYYNIISKNSEIKIINAKKAYINYAHSKRKYHTVYLKYITDFLKTYIFNKPYFTHFL